MKGTALSASLWENGRYPTVCWPGVGLVFFFFGNFSWFFSREILQGKRAELPKDV